MMAWLLPIVDTMRILPIKKDWLFDFRDTDDREYFEPLTASMIDENRNDHEGMRATLRMLASMLEDDQLPESGRRFVVSILEAILAGEDPRRLIPPRRRKPGTDPVEIMVEVELKRSEHPPTRGSTAKTYKQVAERHGMTPGTVQKLASHGRAEMRKSVSEYVRAGIDRNKVVEGLAGELNLPVDHVEKLLSGSV